MEPAANPLESILAVAVEIGSADERQAFVEQACAGDAELKRRALQMIADHFQAGSFLEPAQLPSARLGPQESGGPTLDQAALEKPGAMIGPYKLMEQIGEGGFGLVFVAEQTHPVRRKVALKVIKPGMDTRQVIARFEAERQALALMDHPNIAKVLDAGATDGGRPYFVMELVKGQHITQFCDESRLTPRQRLELFVDVCSAVQHAHQKGIIHRDLKPSNVLVTSHDGKPVVKVIDFGIAKAIGQQLTEKTVYTQLAQLIGTPLYMSPEQAGQSGLDVDTRSDIYSLGVLLYELLTGTTPFSKERFQQAAFDEIRRIIREEEPPKPSTRLSDSKDSLPSISAQRHTEPAKLTKLVRGELDWIVMKALEKDRNRRYESANGFAADVQRYLADEAVQACPPSMVYRLRKAWHRNRALVATAGTIVIALLTGLGVATWQAIRATHAQVTAREAQVEAERNLDKAHRAVNDSFVLLSQETLLREPALEPLRKKLLEQALRYYQGFAAEHLADAKFRAELVATNLRIAILMYELRREGDWVQYFEQGIEGMIALMADEPGLADLKPLHDGTLWVNAGGRWHSSRAQETRRAFAKGRDLWERLVLAYPSVDGFQNDLAVMHLALGVMSGPAEAVVAYERSCDLLLALTRRDPKTHYRTALCLGLSNLSEQLHTIGREQDSDRTRRQVEEVAELLTVEFPEAAAFRELLASYVYERAGDLLERVGRTVEAEERYRKGLVGMEALVAQHPSVERYRSLRNRLRDTLADFFWWHDKRDQAAALYRQSAAAWEQARSDDLSAQDLFAFFLATCPDKRLRDPQRAIKIATRLLQRQPDEMEFIYDLGLAHDAAGNSKVAVSELRKVLHSRPNDWEIRFRLAMACCRDGDRAEAQTLYDLAVALATNARVASPWYRIVRSETETVLGIAGR